MTVSERVELAAPSTTSRASAGDAVRTVLRGLGQTLITLGVVMLLFCFYELKVTNLVTARAQDQLGDDLRRSWTQPPPQPAGPVVSGASAAPVPPPALGEGLAVIYIPRFGKDWSPKVVVQGVGVPDLKKGPGHIPSTALPGDLGNMVISGHRTTYGAPFNRADTLQPGDKIVLETRTGWFTYDVRELQVVAPTAIEVTYPVPGRLDATPTEHLLTLTTCNPKYSARERLIVHAVLSAASRHDDGPPAALQET